MSTEVVMPQMGESIAEGTIVRWIKNVGDRVERDEPLFEISTDKVDAEIPSPAAGVLTEIKAQAGATVPVNSVVAVIGEAAAKAAQPASSAQGTAAPSKASSSATPPAQPPSPPQDQADGAAATKVESPAPASKPAPAVSEAPSAPSSAPARKAPEPSAGEPGSPGRASANEVIAARSKDRARAAGGHHPDSWHGHRRTRHQGRHPGPSRRGAGDGAPRARRVESRPRHPRRPTAKASVSKSSPCR